MIIEPWSFVFGIGFGIVVAVIHYRCGWKNLFDWGEQHEGTNGTVQRK